MSDIVDIATAEIIESQAERIKSMRRKVFKVKQQSSQFCIDCGEPIPLKRQQAISDCCLCVDCQKEKEKKQNAKL